MRRADRLFQLVQILRRRRTTTALYLAERLEVSERTIYRDVRDLILSGVPIMGEAGVGYTLSAHFDLPPLMFTEEEIEALVLGARIVRSFGDPQLRRAVNDALGKVETVLPKRLRGRIEQTKLYSLNFQASPATDVMLSTLRRGARDRCKARFNYTDGKGVVSIRTVRPLGLFFVAPHWILTAWCELRNDFRNFRVDRCTDLRLLDESFACEPGRRLEDFLDRMARTHTGPPPR